MTPNSQPAAVDRIFHALSDATRRSIVENLSRGPASISDVAAPFDMSLAAVLQHVQVLERSGLIRTEKVGRVRTCHIEPEGLSPLERWVQERRSLWLARFDRLEGVLSGDLND